MESALRFTSSKMRFTDDDKPGLYRTQIGAANGTRANLKSHENIRT